MALNLAPFGRWTLRDKPAQRRLALRCRGRFAPATTGRRIRSVACAARSAAQPRGSSRLQAEKPAALPPFAAYPPPRWAPEVSTSQRDYLLNIRAELPMTERVINMGNDSSPDDKTGSTLPPARTRRPKRGAFPTPKEEIEKATPYVPDSKTEGHPESEPDQPTNEEGKI